MVHGRAGYTEKKPGDKAFVWAVGLQDLSLERELGFWNKNQGRENPKDKK